MTSDIINLMSFKSFNWPINHNLTTQINNSFIRYCIIIILQIITSHHQPQIIYFDQNRTQYISFRIRSSLTTNEVHIANIYQHHLTQQRFVFKRFHIINLVINIFTHFFYHHFSAVLFTVYIMTVLYAINFRVNNTKPKQIFKHFARWIYKKICFS